MMMEVKLQEGDFPDFVETDPSGRYGRYNEILGKGASKTVYRAFDEFEGIEVAWNQVKLHDFLQSPHDLERLYSEIHLLKTLKHKNIMKFYTSWVDTPKRNLNFITEMFTSGTLRQYRQRHRRVNIRAVKHWCRQILMGLAYLHSHDPPVIHRDLKCDNIFINGNQGEVKIGDLGLAAILRKSKTVHCVGTPEFMAPEVYEEEYDELVDIYSFGMCVLEMVTFEYPYSECNHPAQIYKKVISGTKPEALYKVKDLEIRQFIEKCLATASQRLSAMELLKDPLLHIPGLGSIITTAEPPIFRQHCNGSLTDVTFSDHLFHEPELESYSYDEREIHGMELFNNQDEEYFGNMDITIKGTRKEDGGVFVRLRITDPDGRVRNIYFPFDVEADTALSVATEMVAELDITDYEVTRIAEMIDGELRTLVPGWKVGPTVVSCGSHDYYSMYKSRDDSENDQASCCSNHEGAAVHGRFEQITSQMVGSEQDQEESDHLLSSSNIDTPNFSDEGDDLLYLSSCQPNLDAEIEGGGRKSVGSWEPSHASKDKVMKSFHQANNCSFPLPRDEDDEKKVPDFEFFSGYAKYDNFFGGSKSTATRNVVPTRILRTKSLPVDAVDV